MKNPVTKKKYSETLVLDFIDFSGFFKSVYDILGVHPHFLGVA